MATRQNAPETIREEGVNVHLAQLLRNRGISARAERRSREGIPDVRADLRSGDLVILECKWEDTASLLENQLNERLDAFPEALGMVGVLYPVRLRQEEDTQASLGAATDLQWWVHGSRGNRVPGPRMRTGSVAELADNLRTLPLELEGVDRVAAAADAVGYALEQAAGQVTKHAHQARSNIPPHRRHHRQHRPGKRPRRCVAHRMPKPIPRWDVHFEGLEDYRKDPNTTAADQ